MKMLALMALLATAAGCGSGVPREQPPLHAWTPMLRRGLQDERPEVRAKSAAALARLQSAGRPCGAR